MQKYFVWLQCALGISSSLRTQEILAAFDGNARAIFDASDYDRRVSGVFTAAQIDRMKRTTLAQAELICDECARLKLHMLTPPDEHYPALLRHVMNLPLVLYVRGDLRCLQHTLPIALVGTRRADRNSVDIASRLAGDLARAGCCIVSGGALGIDSAAHWGALHAQCNTVCVLGNGIAHDYLPENTSLRQRIAQSGAVVSEYPGNTAPTKHSFPTRNRIIAGMCAGTIVVEAGERSGSLITATCAAEQGRDVFAVPGDAFGSTYTGGNKLIREGAKPVFSAADVLEEYEANYAHVLNMRQAARDLDRASITPERVAVKRKPAQPVSMDTNSPAAIAKPQPKPLPPNLSELEQNIVQYLAAKPLHIDEIAKAAGAGLGELFAALTKLEIASIIKQSPGKVFELCQN